MSNLAPIADIRVKTKVIENAWNYVFENFHKFTNANKIKVVLAIITKDMPSQLEHSGKIDLTQPILVAIPPERQTEYANRLQGIPTG